MDWHPPPYCLVHVQLFLVCYFVFVPFLLIMALYLLHIKRLCSLREQVLQGEYPQLGKPEALFTSVVTAAKCISLHAASARCIVGTVKVGTGVRPPLRALGQVSSPRLPEAEMKALPNSTQHMVSI
uniref:Uncharacterized protein n=1 Tax=Phocoena sinus TaxID=42100 RepID=A0A8C9EG87_PHOSS